MKLNPPTAKTTQLRRVSSLPVFENFQQKMKLELHSSMYNDERESSDMKSVLISILYHLYCT